MASLTDAEETLRSTTPKANFQRLTRLLMRGGLRLLREIFDSIISPANLPSKLSNPATKAALKSAKPSNAEWDKLYPPSGLYSKSTDFDITLIFRLLRTICGLKPPSPGRRGWDDLPDSSNHSLEADLVRIKHYRNEVYAHSKTMEISYAEFRPLWKEISEALIRIAGTINPAKENEWKKAIHKFLHDPLTPEAERYAEELVSWYKKEFELKDAMERLSTTFQEGMASNNEGLGKVQEELQGLRKGVKQLEQTVGCVGTVVTVQVIHIHIDSISQRGVSISFSHSPGMVGSDMTCTVPIPPEQPQEVGTEGERHQNPPTESEVWNVIKQCVDTVFEYLRRLNVVVQRFAFGSLLITVECSSLQVLEALWEDYRSGHLGEMVQKMLITPQVLAKLGLTDVKLKTFISEEEYMIGKLIFMDNSDAEETLRLTTPKANFQRLTRLLMCGGLRLLREKFDSIISPADLPLKLCDPATQSQLKAARLTRPEWECLYPSPGVYGKTSDFHITLIFRLLRTICGLKPPSSGPRGWDDLPDSSDHSLEADLVRIKYYRNEVCGHSKTMETSDSEFVDLWRNISEALIRIAATISPAKIDEWKKSIEEFFLDPLTPEEERYIEELNTWYKQDMDVKTEVEKFQEVIRTLKLKELMMEDYEKILEVLRRLQEDVKQSQRPAAVEETWTKRQCERLGIEKILLEKYFQNRVTWIDPKRRGQTKVEVHVTCSNNKRYTLWVYVPSDYPNSCPDMVVKTSAKLKARNGMNLEDYPGDNYIGRSRDGYIGIRLDMPDGWKNENTLYLVVMKGLMWLEAYEAHLRSGQPLTSFLGDT